MVGRGGKGWEGLVGRFCAKPGGFLSQGQYGGVPGAEGWEGRDGSRQPGGAVAHHVQWQWVPRGCPGPQLFSLPIKVDSQGGNDSFGLNGIF